MQLKDQVVLITGASSGIGAATARTLAAEGAVVVVGARRTDKLAALATEIEATGGKAHPILLDVTDRASVEAAVNKTHDLFGQLNILINNAGIYRPSLIERGYVEDWEAMFQVNVFGVLYTVNAVLPHMLTQQHGHIVLISSVNARRSPAGASAVYAATKYAADAFITGLRAQVTNRNIRVTSIQPGLVDTEIRHKITDDDVRASFAQRVATSVTLQPEDVAEAVRYAVTVPAHVGVHDLLLVPME